MKYYNHNLYNYTINLLNMFYDLYDIYILIIYYSKYTGSKIDKFRQISTKIDETLNTYSHMFSTALDNVVSIIDNLE